MTYEELLKEIERTGLGFSQYDLNTAKNNPAFGSAMLGIKQNWANATDEAGRIAANIEAENLRKQYGGYLGGADGSGYTPIGSTNQIQAGNSSVENLLGQMQNFGSFTPQTSAPTYTNRYQSLLDDLTGKVTNFGPFTYDQKNDPAYSAYVKQYRREGERAQQNAIAQAAALTGGQVSTAAMTAATQAGDYYGAQLSDKTAELYDNAYQRYLQEYSMLADQLGQIQQAEQLDYNKYLTELNQYNADRNFDYNAWLDQYNILSGNLSAAQNWENTLYNREQDALSREQDKLLWEYQQQQDKLDREEGGRNFYQQQLDAILAAGGSPSAELIGQSGYSGEYVDTMKAYYQQQAALAAAQAAGKSSGSASSGAKNSADYSTVVSTAKKMDGPEEAEAYLNRMVNTGAITADEAAYIYMVVLGYDVSPAVNTAPSRNPNRNSFPINVLN